MAGKLIELPRRLEWKPVETWSGKVKGTLLWTQVVAKDAGYQWFAWNGPIMVDSGEAPSSEKAMQDAEKALETGVLVIRTLPSAVK
jgi:hypothetical protein